MHPSFFMVNILYLTRFHYLCKPDKKNNMNTLDSIREPIKNSLMTFDYRIHAILRSDIAVVNKVVCHFLSASGKRIRPIVVFLSGGLSGNINEQTQRLALMVELLHSASLLHDDVIDDSDTRRSLKTVNAIWGNKYAIMLGDYVLSKCISVATVEDTSLISLFAFASQALAEGELLQGETVGSQKYDEDRYYTIIQHKTGALFQICCEGAAIAAGADETKRNRLKHFGMNLGTMFQIKDDILDYSENSPTGKEHGNDIREGKVTLPLIHLLQKYPEHREKANAILSAEKNTPEEVHNLIQTVIRHGGIEYAQEAIARLHRESLELLDCFPDSIYKQSLIQLLDFFVVRNQ